MKEVEKIEKIREYANVSNEEAKDALKICGGDVLDAMVYLERLGHARRTPSGAEDRAYYQSTAAVICSEPVYQTAAYIPSGSKGPSLIKKFGRLIGRAVKKSMQNYLVVSYDGVVKFRMSVFVFLLLLMFFSFSLLIPMFVSLSFGVKYSFTGKDDLSGVNRIVGDAGDRAYQWWSSYRYNPEIADLCHKYDKQK